MDTRKLIALIASFTMILSVSSCGKDSSDKSAGSPSSAAAEEKAVETSAASGEESSASDEEESEEETTEASSSHKKSGKASAKSEETTSASSKDKSESTGTATSTTSKGKSKGSSKTTTASAAKNSSSSSKKTTTAQNSSENSVQTTTSSAPAEEPTTAPPAEEESPYTAEIDLSSSSVKGSGVTVNGSVFTITEKGDYLISGSLGSGQVIVKTDAEKKVRLILNGVDISCPDGPAIFISQAKRCNVELAAGTVSTLTGGGTNADNNGAFFSNDTLCFKGTGTLSINATAAHGIVSDDDIIIEEGTYNITSVKSGLFAHDNITVSGGDLTIKGGTNGIKSKGTIDITGGHSVISGGTKEEKSSVYSAGPFNYTGGYLYAAGNKVSVPTTSSNPYIVADTGENISAGSNVTLFINGNQAVSFEPHNNFRSIMILSPEITNGTVFSADIAGKHYGDFTADGTQNVFTLNS